MTKEEAIKVLKNAVKDSHIANQPHLDLSLLTADKRPLAQEALMFLQATIGRGEMTEDELKTQLGLI